MAKGRIVASMARTRRTCRRSDRARRFGEGRFGINKGGTRCADWPFSFVNICEVLGFDVDAMRARLLTRYPAPRRRARVRSPIRGRMVSLAVRRSASARTARCERHRLTGSAS